MYNLMYQKSKPCAAIALNGNILQERTSVKYLGVTFDSGLKLSLTCSQENEVFRAFNYICLCWVYCLSNVTVLFTAHILSAGPTLWS